MRTRVVRSRTLPFIAGFRQSEVRTLGRWAAIALAMMMIGAIGTGVAPPQYFGIVERCSVFAATGFNAVLGWYLFTGFDGRRNIYEGTQQ